MSEVDFERGFQAGFVARAVEDGADYTITKRHWMLAAGTLIGGIGAATLAVAGRSNSKWAGLALSGAFLAAIVGATFAATDVLMGKPTPKLRIRP